ncbi:MAG TPA: S8 family serine peptidase [Egibacteraceae bacterium]|jgi:subtilisin family serine protease|nr:S8 family serine peptidase [Egibacteraceae bacterium]
MGSRRALRLRRLVTAVTITIAAVAYTSPEAGTHARVLGTEWWECLRSGEPPSRFDAVVDAHRARLARARRLAGHPSEDPTALPLVIPKSLLEGSRRSLVVGDGGLPGVTVAIIDSGIDGHHHDLVGSTVLRGLDLLNPCGDGRTDVSGHGTAVAGVIASQSRGAASGVRLLPVRTSLGTGTSLRWMNAAGIVWAADNGADVINLSRASRSTRPSRLEHAAVRYATSRGVVVVASAGNDPRRPVAYPAAYPEVIAVTSTDAYGQLSIFAAHHGGVDIAAPGSKVATLAVDGGYGVGSGTSIAAPVVAATVARLKVVNPQLGPRQIQRLLVDTAGPLPFGGPAGAEMPFGVLNVEAALRAAGASMIALQAPAETSQVVRG